MQRTLSPVYLGYSLVGADELQGMCGMNLEEYFAAAQTYWLVLQTGVGSRQASAIEPLSKMEDLPLTYMVVRYLPP